MPFTLAHVVLARPLWRTAGMRLPLSGIVVGSVAPDLEYLAHLNTERTIGHLLHGVFLLDLPLALVLLALWHRLIKRPVVALVSPRLRPPIDTSPFALGPAARFGLVVVSILTGVAGHLLWDGFTHRDGFITTRVSFLQEAIGRPHVYDLFNYASTFAGMVLLGWWWWRAVEARSAAADPCRIRSAAGQGPPGRPRHADRPLHRRRDRQRSPPPPRRLGDRDHCHRRGARRPGRRPRHDRGGLGSAPHRTLALLNASSGVSSLPPNGYSPLTRRPSFIS